MLRDAAVLLHHFRGVTREVLFQQLKHAARMLQCFVLFIFAEVGHEIGALLCVSPLCVSMRCFPCVAFVDFGAVINPAFRVVLLVFFLPARKYALKIFGSRVIFRDQHGGIGVVHQIFAEVELILQRVTNQGAEKNDVRARPQRQPYVRHCGRAAETRVHVNHLRAALLGIHHPLKADGMIFRHVRAHDQDRIGVEQIFG